MAAAERRSVPLKRRCSRKCDAPASSRRLVTRAGADPVGDGHRADIRHGLGDQADAARQNRCLYQRRRERPREGRRSPPRSPPRSFPASAAPGPRSPRSATSSASKASSKDVPSTLAGADDAEEEDEERTRRGRRRGEDRRPPTVTVGRTGTGTARAGTALGRRGQRQGDLALRVDVVHPNLDGLAQRQHVLDVVDPLATRQRRQLRDVQQAVPARQHVDEGTELGDVDHPAPVDRADVGGRRVQDQRDAAPGLFHRVAVLGTDRHRADHTVVVDGDVRTGLLLQGVDDLALGADDLTDLVDRDLHGDDLRRAGGHVVTTARRWPRP